MHWYIAAAFLLMWALAMASSYTFGGFVHILLGAAVVMVVFRLWKIHRNKQFGKGI